MIKIEKGTYTFPYISGRKKVSEAVVKGHALGNRNHQHVDRQQITDREQRRGAESQQGAETDR